ncbi:hypothetical protein E2C01_099330 [Portunus trituberculatus]|uniref:Uncharacterized protein n=1 Tax=Portunus trituberculatus TaxID=210409 RepID=A0A5B7K580_PORTR|nr:hypothetical protein [Portunus trituberculatus]
MSLKHSPALAINRWPADLTATPTHITLSRRAVPPQSLIRRTGPIRRQSGSLVRRLHSAQPVARPVAGLPLAGSGIAFGRRIPAHFVKGRRWKTLGLPEPIGQYGIKDKGRRNMVERLRMRSRKPLRNKGLANMRQDSLRRVEERQLRRLQLASLPATLQVSIFLHCLSVEISIPGLVCTVLYQGYSISTIH